MGNPMNNSNRGPVNQQPHNSYLNPESNDYVPVFMNNSNIPSNSQSYMPQSKCLY